MPLGLDAQTTGSDSSLLTITSVADSYVDSSNPDTNYGTLGRLNVSANSIQAYTYIKFDLSSIPQGVYIVNATLKVFLSGEGGNLYWLPADTVGAYRGQDNSWAEQVITWNSKPAFSSTATSEWLHGIIENAEYKTWDVTQDVQSAQQSGVLTEVLRFSEKIGDGYLVFQSKDGSSTPKIDIEYSITPPINTPTPTPIPTPIPSTPTPTPTPPTVTPTPSASPSPTPTVPELSLIILLPLIAAIALVAVGIWSKKQRVIRREKGV